MQQTEDERKQFTLRSDFSSLSARGGYRAAQPTQPGLFVYHFRSARPQSLGYDEGLTAMRGDPFYDPDWRDFLALVQAPDRRGRFRRYRVFALAVLCAGSAVVGRLCSAGLALVWREEGKIAKANRGRDPLYLFAALQRQLGYPEVPRSKPKDDVGSRIEALKVKIRAGNPPEAGGRRGPGPCRSE